MIKPSGIATVSTFRRFGVSRTPLVMGVLNVTPDSFSDGGDHFAPADAVACSRDMIAQGADIIDVGPESTRPGAAAVPAERQIDRAIPVIRAIRAASDEITISIDTRLASVAKAAFESGADMVNDVSALRDDEDMADCVAVSGAAVVLMHMRGSPMEMQEGGGPHYDDVVNEIAAFLAERRQYAVSRGIDASRIIFDPGIGFGKRLEHNLLILRRLDRLAGLGQPLMVGASRKAFIGSALAIEDPRRRGAGSLACAAMAVMAGASIVRAHDVRATVEVVRMCSAVRQVKKPDNLFTSATRS